MQHQATLLDVDREVFRYDPVMLSGGDCCSFLSIKAPMETDQDVIITDFGINTP
jgi:hypothetical protein